MDAIGPIQDLSKPDMPDRDSGLSQCRKKMDLARRSPLSSSAQSSENDWSKVRVSLSQCCWAVLSAATKIDGGNNQVMPLISNFEFEHWSAGGPQPNSSLLQRCFFDGTYHKLSYLYPLCDFQFFKMVVDSLTPATCNLLPKRI